MEKLEKQIEEAAYKACDQEATQGVTTKAEESMFYQGFMSGAKSQAAKEFWQQGMYDRKQLNEAIETGINEGLRKQNQGMYSKEEVENILTEYTRSEFAHNSQPIKFFIKYRRNKKK